MHVNKKNKLYFFRRKNQGFAIPQVLILGVGIAVGVSGLIAASILGLTGSRINRQELIAKASSYSGITTIKNLLNDSNESSLFHYFWLVNSCSENATECNQNNNLVPNPSQEHWQDSQWCQGLIDCAGRQKAPICTTNQEIFWDEMIGVFSNLFDDLPELVADDLENSKRDFNQSYKFISTKYTGTEQYGISSILIEGMAVSKNSNVQTASNKLRVNIQIASETPEAGFGFLSIGENQLDGKESLFLGNLTVTSENETKGSIIWRRNLEDDSECRNLIEQAKGYGSSLPGIGNGGIWAQPIGLPKQPRLSNVKDIGILICTSTEFQREGTNCRLNSDQTGVKVYRIHSLYAKGPGSQFEISTTDNSKIILEIMGDIDISNGGIFCHKDGLNSCGSGKPENLTILFKQKTNTQGNKIACNHIDDFTGGVRLKETLSFNNYQYPIDNNQLPGSSFLIDNTGDSSFDRFAAFVYGPKTTFLSVRPESQWVQITNSAGGSNSAGMIVTSRSSYGWIKNIFGGSFEDKMVNLILSPNYTVIPYLGQKDYSFYSQEESNDIEVVAVGYKINALPQGSTIDRNANKILLIYSKENESYYLRTFDIYNANPANQTNSEYSYPVGFAKMNPKDITTHVDLQADLDTLEAKNWLDIFDIKVQKLTLNSSRNFAGAAWVKNLCLDSNGEKKWDFSRNFIDKLTLRHGEEFNWGVRYYRGRSIILWDTLRDFKS